MSPDTTAVRGVWWRRIRIDRFLLAIITAALIASILPARGAAVPFFDSLTTIMIAVLFFLYGTRLEPREALAGLKHWRLHAVILSFTFVVFPLIGLSLRLLAPQLIPQQLYLGLLYLTLVPSTVQSSINFTSIARGNVAGAIVSASFSNLIGVLVTPLLVLGLMSTTSGLRIDPGSIWNIVAQILLPFIAGQLSRRWTAHFVAAHKKAGKLVDHGVIVLVVYAAFSAGMREGIWGMVTGGELVITVAVCAVMLTLMLSLSWSVAGWLGFSREDRIAIQFCGTKKSLATGLPMATVLFASMPVGLIVLPLMIFHQAQLMVCGALAGRYARKSAD